MSRLRTSVLLVAVLAVAACGGRGPVTPEDDGAPVDPMPRTETRPVQPAPPTEPVLTPEQQRALQLQQLMSVRTLYFEYDSSDIKPEFLDVIEAHARNLAANPSQNIILEGHCDERGSREYNVGLGERRAHAVRRAMLLQGVSASQIRPISYGEERPAVPGHNESAWARNRRVEIIYR